MIALVLLISTIFLSSQVGEAASAISEDINTGNAARALGINSIDKIDINSPRAIVWLYELDRRSMLNQFRILPNNQRNIVIEIEINGIIIYTNDINYDEELSKLENETEAIKPIYDSADNTIGHIKVKAKGYFLLGILGLELGAILVLSFIALMLSKILSMFLVIPIINPINQLETKVKAIAQDDQETALNTQLTVKKPLREIESLIDSTNGIMSKLHGYNEMLENQKEILENQNSELEMQNEELLKSKQHIQEQQAQLVQSEKMASVGMLTAAITHEINTPIGAINSNAQLEEMLLEQLMNHKTLREDEELKTMFVQLKEVNDVNLIACSRIIEIIRSLKSYSRIDQADFQEANINEGIKSVLVLTRNLLKTRIIVHEDYGDIPMIRCFPGQLNQVFMNIVVNASQAIEKEGEIFIHTYEQDSNIYIVIKDTGVGIDQENITKLFEPGFTTKGVGIGLGLGLYISYNIIMKHQGEITVSSELDKGTEFMIRIPMNIEISN